MSDLYGFEPGIDDLVGDLDGDAEFYSPDLDELYEPEFDPEAFLGHLAERDEQLLGQVGQLLEERLGPLAGQQHAPVDDWVQTEGMAAIDGVLDGLTDQLGDFDRDRAIAVAAQMVEQHYAENPGSTIPPEHVAKTALQAAARTVAEMQQDPLEAAGAQAGYDRVVGDELDKLRGFKLTEEQRAQAIQLADEAFAQHLERGGRPDDRAAGMVALRGAAELVAGEPATETAAAARYIGRLEAANAQHRGEPEPERQPRFPDAETERDVMHRLFPLDDQGRAA